MTARPLTAALAALALTSVSPQAPVGADDAADPEVVAARHRAAIETPLPTDAPPAPEPLSIGGSSSRQSAPHSLRGISTSSGYVEVAANDYARNDDPGFLTTTLRVWGNAATFRSSAGPVRLTSQFTCTGVGISGLSVGTSGVTVTGGADSRTLTWNSARSSSSEVRQAYTGDGHFRCKASNASLAKTTRRSIGTATYKTTDTRAQDEYSFWW